MREAKKKKTVGGRKRCRVTAVGGLHCGGADCLQREKGKLPNAPTREQQRVVTSCSSVLGLPLRIPRNGLSLSYFSDLIESKVAQGSNSEPVKRDKKEKGEGKKKKKKVVAEKAHEARKASTWLFLLQE